jgi:hypothetical protein
MRSIEPDELELEPETLTDALESLCSGDLTPLRKALEWTQSQDGICGLLGRLIQHPDFTREEIERGRKLCKQMLLELDSIDEKPAAQRARGFMRWLKQWATILPGIPGRTPLVEPEELRNEVHQLQTRGCTHSEAIQRVALRHSISTRTVERALMGVTKRQATPIARPSQTAGRALPPAHPDSARPCRLISHPAIIEPEKAQVDAAGRRETTRYPSNAPRRKPRTSPA